MIDMSNHEKIVYIILAVIWIRIIWQGVCIENLYKELNTTRLNVLNWLYDIGKNVESYMEMPDNLSDEEKQRMERNQKRAKEVAKEWGKKNG